MRGFCFVLFLLLFVNWGVLFFVGVVCWGGHAKLCFAKLHAQFAYYKSPELGLNLSGS